MPNHIHLIWEMLEPNGKEMPNASFMKFTGHQFLVELRKNHPHLLPFFNVETTSRKHHFWQRNSLPFLLINEEALVQKLVYIHNNPLQEKWQLVDRAEDYVYSSARFYQTGNDEFEFLTHWKDRWPLHSSVRTRTTAYLFVVTIVRQDTDNGNLSSLLSPVTTRTMAGRKQNAVACVLTGDNFQYLVNRQTYLLEQLWGVKTRTNPRFYFVIEF